MNYYLAKWQWETEEPMPEGYWSSPDGARLIFDLRPLPAQATKVIADGYGFFEADIPLPVGSYDLDLGTDLNAVLTNKKIKDFKRLINGNLTKSTPLDLLWEAITDEADPTGQTGAKPLSAKNGIVKLRIGSIIKTKPLDKTSKHWEKIKQLKGIAYAKVKEAVVSGKAKPDLHKMFLTNWQKQFDEDYHSFLPLGAIDEGTAIPQTTITENWNCSNSDNIDCNLDWTEIIYGGDFDILDNRIWATATNANVAARAEVDLSSDDHYSQVDIVQCGSGASYDNAGPVVRFNSGATTFYVMDFYQNTDKLRIFKVEANVWNLLKESAAITPSFPEAYKIEVDGSDIVGYQAGVERVSVSDNSIDTNTRCGVFGRNKSAAPPILDNFAAGDLAVGGPETAAFTPVSIKLTLQSFTAGYVYAQTAGFTPLSLKLTIQAITATHLSEWVGAFSSVPLKITIGGFTAIYEAELAAEFIPLSILLTSPPMTATYLAEFVSAFTPLSLIITIPDMTASSEAGETAAFTAVSILLTIQEFTATFAIEEAASFTPLSIVLTLPAQTATYLSELEANFTPLSIKLTIPDFTASYISIQSADFTPLSLLITIPDFIATHKAEFVAGFSPLSLLLTISDFTAIIEGEGVAGFTPLSLILTIPSFTASYEAELLAAFIPLSILITIPDFTAISVSGAMVKIKLAGVFVEKPLKIKVGGVFINPTIKII